MAKLKKTTEKSTAEITAAKPETRGKLSPPWKPGQSGNPKGKPKGHRSYSTVFREALSSLAKKTGRDPDTLEREIIESGIARAIKGDYRFYKDNLDRLHGTPTQTIKATVETVLPDKDTLDSMDKFLETKPNDPGANT